MRAVEYMVFGANIGVLTKFPDSIQKVLNMCVYSDVV